MNDSNFKLFYRNSNGAAVRRVFMKNILDVNQVPDEVVFLALVFRTLMLKDRWKWTFAKGIENGRGKHIFPEKRGA